MRTNGVFPNDAEARRLLVGPGSVAWRFGSDPRLYLVALCPLILQVAHPTVGADVRDFSDFEQRPWERLRPRLGISWSGRDERRCRAMGRAARATTPLLPPPLRVLGPAQLRVRRRAIARGPLGPGAPAEARTAPGAPRHRAAA